MKSPMWAAIRESRARTCFLALPLFLLIARNASATTLDDPPALAELPQARSVDVGSGWRFLHSNASRANEAISVMRAADGLESDPELAGLMLSCSGKSFDVLVMVLKPYPPRTRVTVRIGQSEALDAELIHSGLALKLPLPATLLADGPWRTQTDLPVEISFDGTLMRGTVPIRGLDRALTSLLVQCADRAPASR